MNEGLLWYDNQKNVEKKERITAAADFFKSKYGYTPEKCFVNPITLGEPMEWEEQMQVIPNEQLLRNHFWLEFSEK